MAFSRENTADQGSNLNPIAGYASGYAYMHDESESSQMGPFLQVGSAPGGCCAAATTDNWADGQTKSLPAPTFARFATEVCVTAHPRPHTRVR